MQRRFLFATASETVRVVPDTVVYVRADGNYSSINMADGSSYVLTMQLGHIERHIAEMTEPGDRRFVRIGKSLIVNCDYITYINPARQKLTLSDGRFFHHELTASREALRSLKDFIEKEEQNV